MQIEDFDRCTRCGLCEQACPTYRLLHFEPDSPRGRIFLMKEYAEGKAAMSDHLAEHLYKCLGCRACETVCPAGVPYGRLLEYGRHEVETHLPTSAGRRRWRAFRSLAFERLLPNRALFGALLAPAQALQRVPGFARLLASVLPGRLRRLVSMIPEDFDAGAPLCANYAAGGERRARVGLFTGCVMSSLFAQTHAATARVLARNGCEVVVVPSQWCCGALNVHAGEKVHASQMARANIDAFEKANVDAVIVNSAGCGALMKEYPELLRDDAAYAAKAQAFAAKTKDVSEFLAEFGLRPEMGELRMRVTYQDACHLVHGQRIRRQPRELLQAVPGLDYVELREADRCCGAAGVYSLTQPELSEQILDEKLDAIVDSGAQVVATANPGCQMQLQAGLAQRHLRVRVCHVLDLIDLAYRKVEPKTAR